MNWFKTKYDVCSAVSFCANREITSDHLLSQRLEGSSNRQAKCHL